MRERNPHDQGKTRGEGRDNPSRPAEMTCGGIGPRLGLTCSPYITLSMLVRRGYPEFSSLGFLDSPRVRKKARVLGFTWLGLGVLFWAYSGTCFLKHFRTGRLITKGPFALCRNPIYSSIIVFIVPGLALIENSGLILSIAGVPFVGFKNSIHGETAPLRKASGEEYEAYEKSVNEIIPLPWHPFASSRSGAQLGWSQI